jgi:hypothetical protein
MAARPIAMAGTSAINLSGVVTRLDRVTQYPCDEVQTPNPSW